MFPILESGIVALPRERKPESGFLQGASGFNFFDFLIESQGNLLEKLLPQVPASEVESKVVEAPVRGKRDNFAENINLLGGLFPMQLSVMKEPIMHPQTDGRMVSAEKEILPKSLLESPESLAGRVSSLISEEMKDAMSPLPANKIIEMVPNKGPELLYRREPRVRLVNEVSENPFVYDRSNLRPPVGAVEKYRLVDTQTISSNHNNVVSPRSGHELRGESFVRSGAMNISTTDSKPSARQRDNGFETGLFQTMIQAPTKTANLETSINLDLKVPTLSVPEVIERVETLVHQGGGEMTVSLTPPELGRVEIHVTTQGGNVEVEMRSESELAKGILESALGDLRQSLQTHDLNLVRVDVFSQHSAPGFQAHSDASNGQQGKGFDSRQNPWREELKSPKEFLNAQSIRGQSVRSSGLSLKI